MADARSTDRFADVAPEVRRYLETKGVRASGSWREFASAEHAHAFTVARSAGYDILGDIKSAVEKAIRERQDFEDFRKQLEPVLKAKGWWGKKANPETGEIEQLGSLRRLKTIYWANTRTAYAAGQWEKIEAAKRVLPYLIYVESTAERKREEHLAWVGTILPVDHPWWDSHYPPNGWGCMCRVRQISEWEAKNSGYDPDNPREPPDFGARDFRNRRTGRTERVPVGIDPGWNVNPGKLRARQAADLLAGKIDAMPADMRRIAAADLAGSWLLRMIQASGIANTPATGAIAAPVAVLPDALKEAIGAVSNTVRFSVADAAKQSAKRRTRTGDPSVTADDYRKVQTIIDTGRIERKGERDIVFRALIDGKWWQATIRRAASAAHEIYLKSMRRMSQRQSDGLE